MFAVIHADLSYDYLEGLECEKLFSSYEEAQEYINNISKKRLESWIIFSKYVDDYLETIKVPEFTTYQEWLKYGESYLGYINSYTHVHNFKEYLKESLIKGYGYKKEALVNYNPPLLKRTDDNLFIVEIKEKENGSS